MNSANSHMHQFYAADMGSFPLPTRPINTENIVFHSRIPEERLASQVQDNCCRPATARSETEDGEKETAQELLRAILKLHEKLPAEIQSEVHVPNMDSRGVKIRSASTRRLDGSLDKLSHKLERFKIRTVQLGGVIREEEKS